VVNSAGILSMQTCYKTTFPEKTIYLWIVEK